MTTSGDVRSRPRLDHTTALALLVGAGLFAATLLHDDAVLPRPLGIVIWAFLVVALAWDAWRIARVLCPRDHWFFVGAAAALLFQVLAATVVTLLGHAGVLSLAAQILAVTAITAAVALLWPRGAQPVLPAGAEPSGAESPGPLGHLGRAALVLGLLASAVYALNAVRYTPMTSDDMWYHLPMVAEWIRTGATMPIETIPIVARAYPGFREAIIAFLSLPLRNEHLGILLWEVPLFAAAMYWLLRRFDVAPPLAAPAAAYALTAPQTYEGYDLALALHFIFALLFLQRFLLAPGWRDAALAGMSLGALAATKYSGVIYAGVLLVGAAVQALAQGGVGERWRALGRGVLLAAALAVVVGGVWYIRNILIYVNPLYPAEIRVAGYTLFEGPVTRESLVALTLGWNVGPLLERREHFGQAFGPLLPLLALAGFGVGALAFAVRRTVRAHLLLLMLPPLFFVAFLQQPFNEPSFQYNYNMRYLMPWFAATLAVAVVAIRQAGGRGVERVAGGVFLLASVYNLFQWTRWWWIIATLTLVALVLYRPASALAAGRLPRLGARARSALAAPLRLALAVAAVAVAAFALARTRDVLQYSPEYGYADNASTGGWATIAAYVHRHVAGKRIAVVGDTRFFPLYGDTFSNAVTLLDVEQRTGIGTAMTAPGLPVPEIVRRAREARADVLVCFRQMRQRTGAAEYRFEGAACPAVLAAYPREFAVLFERDGAYVLERTEQPGGDAAQ